MEIQSIKNALNYLTYAQSANGGWEDNVLTTSIVLDALLVSGESTDGINKSLDYLESKLNDSLGNVELTARMALVFSKANRTAKLEEALSWLRSAKNEDDGWGYEKGFRSDPLNTLLVGKLHGKSTWLAENLDAQIFSEGDIFVTAQLVKNLAENANTSSSVEFLKQQKSLTFVEKAVVLSAFSKARELNYATALATEIESSQREDGSFGSLLQTAFAVQALADYYSVAVDLSINASDIYFNSTRPTAGDIILITAAVRNLGTANASNVSIAFFDNASLIGEDGISIPANSSANASIAWIAVAGKRSITAAADWNNAVAESNESNNNASLTLFVNSPPSVAIIYPNGGEYLSRNATIKWLAQDADNDALNSSFYYSASKSGAWISIAENLTNASFYAWNIYSIQDGNYYLKVSATDGLAVRSNFSSSSFAIDNTPPSITAKYLEKVADYEQFVIQASISDANLGNVTFLQNSARINFTANETAYSSLCLGPFTAGTALSYSIIAEDKANNFAAKEFNLTVARGEIKIEGEGKLKEENRSLKIELEVSWKKGEAQGELELQEKIAAKNASINETEEKEEFKAHGKIDKLYKDCEGTFRISGTAKVEHGEGANKTKENVSFSGSVTANKITIAVDGREFELPAKVKIKEKIETEKSEDKVEKPEKGEEGKK